MHARFKSTSRMSTGGPCPRQKREAPPGGVQTRSMARANSTAPMIVAMGQATDAVTNDGPHVKEEAEIVEDDMRLIDVVEDE